MLLTIEYELTESDFEEFNVQHHLFSTTSRNRRVVSKWIISVLYVILGIYFLKDYRFIWSALIGAVSLAIGITWFVLYERYHCWRIRRNTHRLLQEGSNVGMLGKQSIILAEDHVLVKDVNGQSEYKKPFIKKIVENEKYLYCYISSIMAMIIPKNAFASESEIEVFKKSIGQFVEPNMIAH